MESFPEQQLKLSLENAFLTSFWWRLIYLQYFMWVWVCWKERRIWPQTYERSLFPLSLLVRLFGCQFKHSTFYIFRPDSALSILGVVPWCGLTYFVGLNGRTKRYNCADCYIYFMMGLWKNNQICQRNANIKYFGVVYLGFC